MPTSASLCPFLSAIPCNFTLFRRAHFPIMSNAKPLEQMTGLEPALSEWRSEVLPITPHLHNVAGDRTRTDTIRLPLYGWLAIAAQWLRRSISNVTRIKYPPLYLLSYARRLPGFPGVRVKKVHAYYYELPLFPGCQM